MVALSANRLVCYGNRRDDLHNLANLDAARPEFFDGVVRLVGDHYRGLRNLGRFGCIQCDLADR